MAVRKKAALESQAGVALRALLQSQAEVITTRWVSTVHKSYPFETIGFLRTVQDQFANPVGHRTGEAAKALIDALIADTPDEDALYSAVEEVIRVRAIQNFPPETAVGIIYAMKDVVREVVLGASLSQEDFLAFLELESRIDAIALMAFGSYARCRERLHQMRVDEFKRSHSQVLRLAQGREQANDVDEADTQKP